MKTIPAEEDVTKDPNILLARLLEVLKLRNDAALSRALEVAPSIISKVRNRRKSVGAPLLIRMHEVSGLSIADLRALLSTPVSHASIAANRPQQSESRVVA